MCWRSVSSWNTDSCGIVVVVDWLDIIVRLLGRLLKVTVLFNIHTSRNLWKECSTGRSSCNLCWHERIPRPIKQSRQSNSSLVNGPPHRRDYKKKPMMKERDSLFFFFSLWKYIACLETLFRYELCFFVGCICVQCGRGKREKKALNTQHA